MAKYFSFLPMVLLEKAMATHSCTLAWRIPGTAEPGGLLSMGSHRVGHDWSDLAAAAAWNYIYFFCTFILCLQLTEWFKAIQCYYKAFARLWWCFFSALVHYLSLWKIYQDKHWDLSRIERLFPNVCLAQRKISHWIWNSQVSFW